MSIDHNSTLNKAPETEPPQVELPVEPALEPPVAPVQYGGFWRRVAAHFIDALILIPIVAIFILLSFCIDSMFIPLLIIQSSIGVIYQLYFTTTYGATWGKSAMDLRIVKLDGSPITFKEANLRYLPYLLMAVFGLLGSISAFYSLPIPSIFFDAGFQERNQLLQQHQPVWAWLVNLLLMLFMVVDVLVLLFNKQKRSLHDQIAGTMVIKLSKASI